MPLKVCQFCAEEIQEAAIKCKHCGEMLEKVSVTRNGREREELGISRVPQALPINAVADNVPSPVNDGGSETKRTGLSASSCPMCGGAVKPRARECEYCGATLLVVSVQSTFCRTLDAQLLAVAVAKWRERLQSNPDDSEANYALGVTYLNQKLRDASIQHLRKATMSAPEVAVAHYNLALVLLNDGNTLVASPECAEAMKELEYASNLDSGFSEAQAYLAFFSARRLSQSDQAQAMAGYEKAIALAPDIAMFHNNLGQCYQGLKKYQESITCFRKAVDIDPAEAKAWANLATSYYLVGQYSDGLKCGEEAVSKVKLTMSPSSQAACHNIYSLNLMKSGQTERAVQEIKEAISLVPSSEAFKQTLKAYQSVPKEPAGMVHQVLVGLLLVAVGVELLLWLILGSASWWTAL